MFTDRLNQHLHLSRGNRFQDCFFAITHWALFSGQSQSRLFHLFSCQSIHQTSKCNSLKEKRLLFTSPQVGQNLHMCKSHLVKTNNHKLHLQERAYFLFSTLHVRHACARFNLQSKSFLSSQHITTI